jgi:hypothetical protein
MDFSKPIQVSVFSDGEMRIVDGHHRVAAAKKLGMTSLPVELQAINARGKTLNKLTQESVYPQQSAFDLAQQRAALPVEQGGLGLLSNNTAAERAAAMGFDLSNPQYHATDIDFTSIRPSSRGKMGAGIYSSPDVQYAEKYAPPNDKRVLPLVSKGYYADADKRSAIFDQVREDAYANNPSITSRELHDLASQEMQNRQYSGFDVDKERLTFNPEDLRSRFAAFDPFRKTAATAAAMGVAAPDLLAQQQPVITQQQIDDEMAKYGLLGR